jgi:glycosyltransferase involved in cell wall biosynthesis
MIAPTLRVLFDGSAIPAQPAGAGIYTIQLARALAKLDGVESVLAAPVPIDGVEALASPLAGPIRRLAWEQRSLRRVLRDGHFDVVHGAHFAVPLRSPAPRVATVHDLTFFRLPRRYSTRHRLYYKALALLARHAERIIVPSKAVAGDAIRFLGYPPERMCVVAEAARDDLAPASPDAVDELCTRLGLERPYLLCVGTAEPGKRAIDAVRALGHLHEQRVPVQLVLAGNPGSLTMALQQQARLLGVGDFVKSIGYVPDSDLAALYTGATALLFPSLYEGFGLPPLEAMACATPVISSSAPAMTEVLEGAALFAPLRDASAIARLAASLLNDASARKEWSERSQAHAREFSWRRAAMETADVYQEVARR